jgi:hypothetical protein
MSVTQAKKEKVGSLLQLIFSQNGRIRDLIALVGLLSHCAHILPGLRPLVKKLQ